MGHNKLIIYTEQLREGSKEEINLDLDPSFFDIHEKELSFETPIHIEGEVYLTEDELVFHLNGFTKAKIPCAICNELLYLPIKLKGIYAIIPLHQLKSKIFDYSSVIREEFLLHIPLFAECHNGQCPERVSLASFLKKEEKRESNPTHFPFSNL